eukprot:scaffold1115_cov136-Chaetoceros_neogracile.AAC.1
MDYSTESTNTNSQEEDMFFDADASIADLFDADGCDNPLFIFDLFESSTDSMLVDLPAATAALLLDDGTPEHEEETEDHTASIVAEEKEKEQNGNHSFIPMKRRKSELINSYQYATDSSSSTRERDQSLSRTTPATTNEKNVNTKASSTMNKVTAPPVSFVLSLLTPEQLEQQLEHTKNRLAEFMERSTTSRKRLNDQVDFKYQDYRSSISQPDSAIDCPPQQEVISSSCQSPTAARKHRFNGSNSTAIPASTALSQSRAHFASFVNNRMNIASLTL